MARILLIEDSAAVAESTIVALSVRGHDVVWAARVDRALLAYRDDTFDVVLSDYELPDGTGLDFFQGVLDRSDGEAGGYWILWSGIGRHDEAAAHPVGDAIDIVETKDHMIEVFDLIDKRASIHDGA